MTEPAQYEAIIGLEIHAELQTDSKMFCSCQVVDSTQAEPNTAVCPVCAGMPGMLPVPNQQAIEYGLRVALALDCQINYRSIFARKNYFYPDLPKGYQISQYEEPLARNGKLTIMTPAGARTIRVRRVHLEEDTGKLTHVEGASLIDLNRAGVPLLEIVSEPDMRSPEEARVYAEALRNILRYLGVNAGDMEKGLMRIEPNVSVRPTGSAVYGTRTEIKNLNSFRALERGISYEIQRQITILESGREVIQETVGWDEGSQATFVQRVKEGEEDYRYFPEPDLPPLTLDPEWVEQVRASLPESPMAKSARFISQYGLSAYLAELLVAEQKVADYFEAVMGAASGISPSTAAGWLTGEIFSLLNESGEDFSDLRITPEQLGNLLKLIQDGEINTTIGKAVLAEMYQSGKPPAEIIRAGDLQQISNVEKIAETVGTVLSENSEQVTAFLGGKTGLANWFFGQVMRATQGKANPHIVREELQRQLASFSEQQRD
jgi:aspartyl-tRNA(Asn)/glutamyl-tRNA(Gln) amidotransferase subunit B